ncbi:transcriptional repressor [Lactobacillus sp. DCY120]|uniref:Transcriptional repressor n=1 Tax=Bombilactobacillus apium TaxID=2675299 RepID=A0A850R026_9LACO|nr:Fur family transcriptional regulator [Bombilactobacillus apium]NVY96399.1 transcriptional repressor [Bombilactobacillus apium]
MTTIDPALVVLTEHHYKITKQRRCLLTYLAQHADHYLSLTALDDHLRQQFPKMSHDTVYRNIKEMQPLGVVETKMFPSGLWVKFQCDFQAEKHSHFICQECGRTLAINLPDHFIQQPQLQNYQINSYNLEIWGLCEQCQIKSATRN